MVFFLDGFVKKILDCETFKIYDMIDALFHWLVGYMPHIIMIACNVIFLIVAFTRGIRLPGLQLFKIYAVLTLVEDALAIGEAPDELTELAIFIVAYLETIVSTAHYIADFQVILQKSIHLGFLQLSPAVP